MPHERSRRVKRLDISMPQAFILVYTSEKHNNTVVKLIVVPIFILDFSFKVCNAALIMPSFGKQFIFVNFNQWF